MNMRRNWVLDLENFHTHRPRRQAVEDEAQRPVTLANHANVEDHMTDCFRGSEIHPGATVWKRETKRLINVNLLMKSTRRPLAETGPSTLRKLK